jgi:hypothetical protein
MKVTLSFVTLAIALSTAACSGGGQTPADGGTDGSVKDATGKDANLPDTGSNDAGDAGQQGPILDPLCTAPATDGGGACVTVDDAGVTCNPLTNAGCDFADGGEACDFSQQGFQCYNAPPNTAAICAACDVQNGPACLPTLTCVPTATGNQCARYCCSDSDCPGGKCDTTDFQGPPGVCVK